MGNEKSNNIFECKLNKAKPNPNSSRQEKEQFIREKYEMKQFTDAAKTRELPVPPKKQMNYHKEGFLTKLEPNSRKAKKLWCTLKAQQSQSPSFYYYHVRCVSIPTQRSSLFELYSQKNKKKSKKNRILHQLA